MTIAPLDIPAQMRISFDGMLVVVRDRRVPVSAAR
jgi:hypothetical protein